MTWLTVESCDDITWNPKLPQRGCPKYAAYMLRMYESVTAMGGPNFSGARIQLPSNLHFKEWEALIECSADILMVDYQKFRFLAGYDGSVVPQATGNHPSMLRHQHNVAA